MNVADLVNYIGGIPFLSGTFEHKNVLSIVAAKRLELANNESLKFLEYLLPINGEKVYLNRLKTELPELKFEEINESESRLVIAAHEHIISITPGWKQYFNIPIRYRKWSENKASSTCAFIPQTIYLGEPAFKTKDILVESLVHEFSHVWMDFITEITDFQKVTADKRYIIPKTQNPKLLRGVLLAAHFAAVVILFYKRNCRNSTVDKRSRINYLHSYLKDCIELISDSDEFSELGYWVWKRLKAFCDDMEEYCQS